MAIPILAIIGPTAVGKTSLSLDFAKALNGEVISVDSRQVYRYMDVGTDKVDPATRRDILHHLIDVVDPDETFSAADFAEQASAAVDRIRARGRVPILVGGTPFYYRAMLDEVLTIDVPSDPDIRRELDAVGEEENGPAKLHSMLAEVDPDSASRLHVNDTVRVIRAIEIFRLSGKPSSWWRDRPKKESSRFAPLYFGLTRPRDELHRTIAKRVRQQFYGGYPEEVRWLLDNGFSPELPSMKGFGYRELVLYHMGKMSLEEGIESDTVATRRFSKRQMTWFRKFSPAIWYDLSEKEYNKVLSSMTDKAVHHLRAGGVVL